MSNACLENRPVLHLMVPLVIKLGDRGGIRSVRELRARVVHLRPLSLTQGPQRGPVSGGLLCFLSSQFSGHPPLTGDDETHMFQNSPSGPSSVKRA